MRRTRLLGAALALISTFGLSGCSVFIPEAPATPAPEGMQAGPGGGSPGARPGGGRGGNGPKAYDEVITEEAETKEGLFTTHRIDDKLFFEIPTAEFGEELLVIGRAVESTLQNPGGFFGGGPRIILQLEKRDDKVVFRQKRYQLVADSTDNIWRQVKGFRNGPVLAQLDIEAYHPEDSSAVIDVTPLFTTNQPDLGSLSGTQANRSWIEHVSAFPRNVEVEATQTGSARPPGAPPTVRPRTQTARIHWSWMKLPEDPMMPRWWDSRVGYISSRYYDFSLEEHGSDQVRFIHRHRLEPSDWEAFERGELVEPVEPIVYWIDPATPEWIKPWVKIGVDKWQAAFEEAGFRNAIRGEYAPEDDPDWSMFDLNHSIIYWRPSTVANATGGQVVDPRTGEIMKGEVNMYHNVMDLLQSWYFIQASPLDERARSLPMPDSLMGRLVEYVVTHEIGHAIGFPHNMKASAQYPIDSIRSEDFLRRMGGHVATLMDYSRFNYVAQPEDSIPVELLVPQVGPYDKFAVRWGYRPVPGAESPDDETATLDEWAKAQEEFPWLRFSTPDSPNDPENLTEAVGDADAVRATELALLNLQRVMDMMLEVTEEPGEDYSTLETMYGQAVGQWGRYMRHVAALIGGAITEEKRGTGARFEPVAEERQAEAMAFLSENAFQVPEMFLDEEILWRIEANGAVGRIRNAQTGLFGTLLAPAKLNTLVEYEALTGGDTYTLSDYMSDMRAAIWTELERGSVDVNIYRRNLQRAFLDRVGTELNPDERTLEQERRFAAFIPRPPRWGNDVRAMLREELRTIDRMAERAERNAANAMTRVHLRDVRSEIEKILEATE